MGDDKNCPYLGYGDGYTNVSICQMHSNCTLKRVNFTVWNYILVNLTWTKYNERKRYPFCNVEKL